ncbi:MAG TPA: hypothetical protein VHL58_18875 [Thermoanaerobaculia bacterium]|nr:hypothetical protein [Thermoanaerobaculia bacterium]
MIYTAAVSQFDRRRAERVILTFPLPARIERQSVSIHEIGLVGSRIEHNQALILDTSVILSFLWDEEKLEIPARVARCELQPLLSERASKLIYHSGLEFTEEAGRPANMLHRMILSFVTRAIEELKRNARGGAELSAIPFLKLDPLDRKRIGTTTQTSDKVYLRCRFWDGKWEKTESLNPRQPPDGFTVLSNHPEAELELLCQTYQASDEPMRKMLRVCSELSLRG